ncbi:MAG: hypothetical protein K2K39_03930 [Clostridia bacterium]|nr:hypothetical protein [Clostridia bacterium]
MKKIFKGLICAGLCGLLAVGATGCIKPTVESEHRDPETAPLRLAIGALDEKFHPLLYTSQNDGTIAGMTQATLMTSNAKGKLAYGDDQPTVALDYQEVYKNGSGETIKTSDGIEDVSGVDVGANGSTSYEFLIKNGVKFSDGVDLTVMDVLFNLYVYLDSVYSGSSTIYSTKIEGLTAYRLQNPDADEDAESERNKEAGAKATQRINELLEWIDSNRSTLIIKDENGKLSATGNDALGVHKNDISLILNLYKEELESDWNQLAGGWKESYKEYNFTEIWQPYFKIEGLIMDVLDPATGERLKNEDGTYKTTLDTKDEVGGVDISPIVDEINEASSPEKVQQFMRDNEKYTEESAKTELQRRYAIAQFYDSYTSDVNGLEHILTLTGTASTTWDEFLLQEKSTGVDPDQLAVPRISGITVRNTNSPEYGGKFNGKTYDKQHDILRIKVKGADPKAKWNFSFSVAPMHYYSDKAHNDAAMADYTSGKVYNDTATNFGVACSNSDWFKDVLAESDRTRVPVGAGAYKCSTYNRTGKPTPGTFLYSNTAYFERNEYFTTLGDGVENAKIKYVTYAQQPDDKIVELLTTGAIDYGEPNATPANINKLNTGNLKQIDYPTGGYGYIGINPQYVPDIEVRRAIMHAIDTSSIFEYYAAGKVNIINRPVSTTSWAYPEGAERYYERITDTDEIINMVTKNGQSEKWFKEVTNGKTKIVDINHNQLTLTFTIAGESTDHPAYQVLKDAERFLEQCGFNISVVTDPQALKNLATGKLTVWAAAWSSSIDPDPYQIYSLDSNASSTKNWNKEGILNSGLDGQFGEEYRIASELNELIKQGRSTLNQTSRERIYAQCFNKIMDLAVEFPTYQRHDLCVYNSAALDRSSMTKEPSYLMGPIGELWKITYTP